MRRLGALAASALTLASFPGVAHADTSLQSFDSMGLTFDESSVPAPEGQTTTVTVRRGDGSVVQTITEPYKGWLGSASIELCDLFGDGRDDLLVEVDSRVSDHRWAIWHTTGGSAKFSQLGVVTGHPESAGPGTFQTQTASGVTFYTIKNGMLNPVPGPA